MIDDNLEPDTFGGPRPLQGNKVLPFKVVAPAPKAKPPDPNKDLIEMFEDYLKAAKAGKIEFAAVASVDHRGVAFSTWEPSNMLEPALITSALGAVSYLHYRYNESCACGAEFDDSLRAAHDLDDDGGDDAPKKA
jgi:hypothetical protein